MYGNPSGLGVVNVAMSNFAKTFAQAPYIANLLAPVVPVTRRSFQYLIFDRANQRVMPTKRSPGGRPTQLSMSYSTDNYVCEAYAAEIPLPRETQQIAEQYGYLATKKATSQVMDAVMIGREAQTVALAKTVSNIATPSSANLWDANTSDPVGQIEALKLQVKLSGVMANTLILGPDMFKAARLNPNVKNQFQYKSDQPVYLSADQLAAAFGVDKVVEARTVSVDGTDSASFMWAGFGILAYVQPVESQEDLSAMKTFVDTTQGVDGYEVLEFPDPHPSTKQDWVSGEMAYAIKVTANETIGVIQHGTTGN